MIYAFKQTIGILASPLVIALLVAGAAAVLRRLNRNRIAAWLFVAAIAIGYLGTLEPVSDVLLGPLERQYAPLRGEVNSSAVRYVVVLGSSYLPRDDIPVTAALSEDGLVRIVGGVRLVRRLPLAKLVVSGGASPGHVAGAVGYARLARALGIESSALLVLDRPLDTAAEARDIIKLIGAAPFILVTSAYHMPRAMRLLKREGAHAIPAPTGHRVDATRRWGWRALLPRAAGLSKTEYALHEYLGFAALATGIQ